MRRIFVLIALLLTIAACRREETTGATATQTTGTVTTTVAGEPRDLTSSAIDTMVPVPPPVVPQCYSGSELGSNGAVSKAKTEFGPKDPIHFSMWLREAPPGLQVSVKVIDEKDKVVNTVPMAAEGLKITTFTIPRPAKTGKYRLEGYWGGNVACEKRIAIQ